MEGQVASGDGAGWALAYRRFSIAEDDDFATPVDREDDDNIRFVDIDDDVEPIDPDPSVKLPLP